MTFETFINSLRLPQADSEKLAQDFRDRWNAMLDHRPPDRYADEFLAPEAVRRNWSLVPLPPESLGEVLAEAARIRGDETLLAIAALLQWTLFDDAAGPGTWQAPYPAALRDDESAQGPFNLVVALGFAPLFSRENSARGIPDGVVAETLRQIACYNYNFHRAYGKSGIFRSQLSWLHCYVPPRHYYRLGRLEFQLRTTGQDAAVYRRRADGVVVVASPPGLSFLADGSLCQADGTPPADAGTTVFEESADSVRCHLVGTDGRIAPRQETLDLREWECVLRKGDPVLETHIPSGGGLLPELVDDSIARSFAFFDAHVPGNGARALVCSSWILSPQLEECLPEKSNILSFQRRFRRFPVAPHNGSEGGLWFLFLKRPPYDPATLPRDTSMRRAVAEWMERGETFCGGAGFILRG